MTERDIIKLLAARYIKMLGINKDQHLRNMCLTIIDKVDVVPVGKLNRWLGYIQKGVIDYNLTTITKENNFSKSLFEKAYNVKNITSRPDQMKEKLNERK